VSQRKAEDRARFENPKNSAHRVSLEGHEDFAVRLVEHLKPKVVVDLGVDYGFSTFAFALPNIGTVYGIDWFQA
jgi:predicted O-methyltransferase YrrM